MAAANHFVQTCAGLFESSHETVDFFGNVCVDATEDDGADVSTQESECGETTCSNFILIACLAEIPMNGLGLEDEIGDSFHDAVGPEDFNDDYQWHDTGIDVMLAVFGVLRDLKEVNIEIPDDNGDCWQDNWDDEHVSVSPEPISGNFEYWHDVSEPFLFGENDKDDDEEGCKQEYATS